MECSVSIVTCLYALTVFRFACLLLLLLDSLCSVSRFDSAHAKVAEKSESILDYQQRLDEKKRAAAAMNAPTLGKRANSKTQSNASTIPASNKKQKTVAASQSTIAPIASPTSTAFTFAADAPAGALLFTPGVIRMSPSFSPSITMNVAVDSTTVVPSRTRLSVRKESEKMVAQEITNQVKQKIAVGVAQQQKMKSNTNNATAVVKKPVTLFAANKIPRVAMLASNSIAAPAVKPSTSSTTFTQIAGLEDVRTAASTINRTKFDLSASLAKPLTWKPYKGKVNAAVKNEAAPSENTPMDVEATTAAITQPFVFTATSSASAGSLTARALPLSSSSSKLNIVAGSSTARVGMKSSQVGVQKSNVVMKEMRREKFQQSSLQARNKATSVAREKSLLSSIPAPIPPIVM